MDVGGHHLRCPAANRLQRRQQPDASLRGAGHHLHHVHDRQHVQAGPRERPDRVHHLRRLGHCLDRRPYSEGVGQPVCGTQRRGVLRLYERHDLPGDVLWRVCQGLQHDDRVRHQRLRHHCRHSDYGGLGSHRECMERYPRLAEVGLFLRVAAGVRRVQVQAGHRVPVQDERLLRLRAGLWPCR